MVVAVIEVGFEVWVAETAVVVWVVVVSWVVYGELAWGVEVTVVVVVVIFVFRIGVIVVLGEGLGVGMVYGMYGGFFLVRLE